MALEAKVPANELGPCEVHVRGGLDLYKIHC